MALKIILFALLLFSVQSSACAEIFWVEQNEGIADTDLRSISIFRADDKFICTAAVKSAYFSGDGGDFWEEIFSLRAEDNEINFITFDCFTPEAIFLATTKGLYLTEDAGENWHKIFNKIDDKAANVIWVALDCFDRKTIYIGTVSGLYISQDRGASWRKSAGTLPDSEVKSIAIHPSNSQVIYLANTYGLFKSINAAGSWKRTYVSSYKRSDEEDDEEDVVNSDLISCIAVDSTNTKQIFISTGKGVFISSDMGDTWHQLSEQGLTCDDVNFIVTTSSKAGVVYAATEEGVFKFSPSLNNWQSIYQGLVARQVRSLSLSADGTELFAATNKGCFKTVEIKSVEKKQKTQETVLTEEKIDLKKLLEEIYASEPTIVQVQEAALRYAQVIHPEQINKLRRDARLKALLPDVSLDYDKTINYDSGSDVYYIGPRDWGFSLSWDVGDLVFSEQLRLVDSNTRLMIQLREEIINEVIRLYYERRKLQAELILQSPELTEEKLTKTLRLAELTANIDGLTGGYFSRHIKKKIFLD